MSSQFNFFQHWYPLSPLEDLDPNKPTPVILLGMRLVIWKSPVTSSYQVFLDQCPHRLAPLSQGRIDPETGNLMCSYHGWQFDCQGFCTKIPQAENTELINNNRDNFRVQLFPSREEQDLLWIWADPNSPELAAQTSLPLSPQVDASKGFVWSSLVRDLEYDWQTLVENVADPSHVPFSHHGVQGNRDLAVSIPIEILTSSPNLIESAIARDRNTKIIFEPPCRLEYEISLGNEGKQLGLITYCIPTLPGKSRIVAQFSRNFAINLHKVTPRWWDHLTNRNLILDGDMVLLHYQEHFLQQQQQQGQKTWKTAYKMPTSADRLVIAFRDWFDRYAEGRLPWEQVGIITSEVLPINENHQHILDRYHQHTIHCRSCRDALAVIKGWQWFLLIYSFISLVAVVIMPDTLRLSWGWLVIAIALLALGGYSWLKFWLEPKFYFIDYIHAEK